LPALEIKVLTFVLGKLFFPRSSEMKNQKAVSHASDLISSHHSQENFEKNPKDS
jgi:hypothetical protein